MGLGRKASTRGPRHRQGRHGRRQTEPEPGLRQDTESTLADSKTIMLFGDGHEMVHTIVKVLKEE
jgi:hypothetical protein